MWLRFQVLILSQKTKPGKVVWWKIEAFGIIRDIALFRAYVLFFGFWIVIFCIFNGCLYEIRHLAWIGQLTRVRSLKNGEFTSLKTNCLYKNEIVPPNRPALFLYERFLRGFPPIVRLSFLRWKKLFLFAYQGGGESNRL